jgi:hypothetical protein
LSGETLNAFRPFIRGVSKNDINITTVSVAATLGNAAQAGALEYQNNRSVIRKSYTSFGRWCGRV